MFARPMLTLASGVTATTALLEFVLVMKDTAGGKKERNKSEENKKKTDRKSNQKPTVRKVGELAERG